MTTASIVIDVIAGWVWMVFIVAAVARWVWAPIYTLRFNSKWRYPMTDPKATGYDEFFPERPTHD